MFGGDGNDHCRFSWDWGTIGVTIKYRKAPKNRPISCTEQNGMKCTLVNIRLLFRGKIWDEFNHHIFNTTTGGGEDNNELAGSLVIDIDCNTTARFLLTLNSFLTRGL